jgi:hypothetical protein
MTDDNGTISFEDFQRRKAEERSKRSGAFHRYEAFFRYYFHLNHRIKKGVNPKCAFVVAFHENRIEPIMRHTENSLQHLEREYKIFDLKGKRVRQISVDLPCEYFDVTNDLLSHLIDLLLNTDNVILIKELSLFTTQHNKTNIAKSLIKALDEAHYDNIIPKADLVFVDYASFLQRSWKSIGAYLDVLTADYWD